MTKIDPLLLVDDVPPYFFSCRPSSSACGATAQE